MQYFKWWVQWSGLAVLLVLVATMVVSLFHSDYIDFRIVTALIVGSYGVVGVIVALVFLNDYSES